MQVSCPICGCLFPYVGLLAQMSNLLCGHLTLPMHVYIHIHICIYTYTYVPMCIFIHMYMYIYIHIPIRPSTHVQLYSHNQLDSYTIIHTIRHACHSQICVLTQKLRIHTYVYMCIYITSKKKKHSCPGHLATTWARSRKRRERLEKNGNECSQLSFTYYVCHQAEVFWSSLPHAMGTWEIIQEKKTKLLKRGDNVCLRHPFFFLDQRQWFQNTNECPQLCYLCSSNKKVSLLICIWKIKAVRLCIYLGMCTYTHVYTYSQSYFGTYIFRTHTCKFTLLGVCVYTSVCIHVCSCVYTEIDWNQCTHTQPCCTYSKK